MYQLLCHWMASKESRDIVESRVHHDQPSCQIIITIILQGYHTILPAEQQNRPRTTQRYFLVTVKEKAFSCEFKGRGNPQNPTRRRFSWSTIGPPKRLYQRDFWVPGVITRATSSNHSRNGDTNRYGSCQRVLVKATTTDRQNIDRNIWPLLTPTNTRTLDGKEWSTDKCRAVVSGFTTSTVVVQY